MAHEIYLVGDRESMAYVAETPWHGLGQKLDPDAPLETWAKEAALEWQYEEAMVRFTHTEQVKTMFQKYDKNTVLQYPERKVIYRSDNHQPLSVVSNNY